MQKIEIESDSEKETGPRTTSRRSARQEWMLKSLSQNTNASHLELWLNGDLGGNDMIRKYLTIPRYLYIALQMSAP